MVTRNKVGGEVDAYCTRCKMVLAHTVLAMVGEKIARVRCNTCGGDHSFRGAPDAPKASTSRASSAGSSAKAASTKITKADRQIISFEQQLAEKDVANAPAYNIKETFAVDQVIRHPTFGLGIVSAVRGDKVDVAFKAETRTLVHGRGGAPAAKPAFAPPTRSGSAGPADKPQSAPEEAPAPQTGDENP